ncbi:MAG: hypothetical protein ACK5MV_08535 [Aminipila sp.]
MEMKTEVSVSFIVPEQAFKLLRLLSSQNRNLKFVCLQGREVMLTGDLLEMGRFSDDCCWDEINDFLEGVE